MTRPAALRTVTTIITTAFLVVLAICVQYPGTWWPKVVSGLGTLTGLGVIAWDLWFWKAPLFNKLHTRPRIDGLWKVSLTPTTVTIQTVIRPQNGNVGPIDGYVVVKQSYWGISTRQYTQKAKSSSRSWYWAHHPGEEAQTLVFSYEGQPTDAATTTTNPRHLGSCTYDTSTSRNPEVMDGTYYTDRHTVGTMSLHRLTRDGKVISKIGDWTSAKAAAGE